MFRLFRITGLCHSNSNSKVNRVERQGGEVGVGGRGGGNLILMDYINSKSLGNANL